MQGTREKSQEPPFYIIDGHVDIVYEMSRSHPEVPFDRIADGPVTLDKMRASNVLAIVAALYCPDEYNGTPGAARYLEQMMGYAEQYLTGLVHIRSSLELENCLEQKTPGMIWLVENADSFPDVDRRALSDAGIKVAGLTHMGKNRIADGNNVAFPNGISSIGKKLVIELSREGFVFDVAHLAEPGFLDLARIHEGPLISSHTGVRPLCDIPRNLSMEQIKIIIERKGVVGIAADPRMLSTDGKASIEDMYRHIDRIAQSFEAGGIAVGSDFCGFGSINRGMEDIARLADLCALLLAHGYPEESVRAIMGRNWYDFYRSIL